MEYIHYVVNILFVIVIYIVIAKVCLFVANYIGEKLGIGKFIIHLWRKIIKKSKRL